MAGPCLSEPPPELLPVHLGTAEEGCHGPGWLVCLRPTDAENLAANLEALTSYAASAWATCGASSPESP